MKFFNRMLFAITLATAIVAYSTNSLSIVFAYDECTPSDVVLGSQNQVDVFSSFYEPLDCNTVGNLQISGADIIDLSGLAQIEYVQGSLSINNNASLTTLSGLSNLLGVAGDLSISGNPLLTDISGLSGIKGIGNSIFGALNINSNPELITIGGFAQLIHLRYLNISNNEKLTSISGFAILDRLDNLNIQSNPALATVGEFPQLIQLRDLYINSNEKLTSISGFVLLDRLDKLRIQSNSGLETITGFDALTSLGRSNYCCGSNYISNNPKLAQIPAFNNLVSIKGGFEINGGYESLLTEITGFTALQTITGQLSIQYHPNLLSITDFAALSTSGGIDISYNEKLTAFPAFPSLTSVGGGLSLSGNNALIAYPPFANIESVQGTIYFSDHNSLTQMPEFANLKSVNGSLQISWNNSLTQIPEFASLKVLNGYLGIEGNYKLVAMNGFTALNKVNGYLNIYYNQQMEHFDGLDGVEEVGGNVFINNNDKLLYLTGLRGLNEIGGYLQIYSNRKLRNMHALRDLKTVGGLDIQFNQALGNLNALLSLEKVNLDLTVTDNYNLGKCTGLAPVLGWPDGAFPKVGRAVMVSNNAVGCNKLTQIMDAVTGPSAPAITDHTVSSEAVSLTFDLATTQDPLFAIKEHQAACFASSSAMGSNTTDVPITDNGSVSSALTIVGSVLSDSNYLSVDVEIDHPLREELELRLRSPAGTEITLWAYGATSSVQSFKTTFPVPTAPGESFDAFNGEDFNGEWTLTVSDNAPSDTGVLRGWSLRAQENIVATRRQSPIPVSGLTNNEEYTCHVRAVTALGLGPVSNSILATPKPVPPGAPVIERTDSGDGEIYLYVSAAPGDVPVTSFDATCTDGINQYLASSSASPITVAGLTNDVSYTCTVTATNSVGTSTPSAPSEATTPEEAIYSLPIWLLYEASK